MYEPLQRMVIPVAFDESASAATLFTWALAAKHSIMVTQCTLVYTEAAVPASTPSVLNMSYTNTVGAVAIATKAEFTQAARSIGDEVKPDTAFDPFLVNPSDILTFKLTTQASGGTTTGAGYFILSYVPIPLGA